MRPASVLGVLALLFSAALALTGSGFQSTLLSYRAAIEGWSLPTIALVMSAYFAGFFGGCWAAPFLIRNAGHIRALAMLAPVAAAVALAHALWTNPVGWTLLRLVSGLCFAGIYMVIESWLREKTGDGERGRTVAIYRFVDLGAAALGQLLLATHDPATALPFTVLAMLIVLSMVPAALTRAETALVPRAALSLDSIHRVSPLAVAACFGTGVAGSAFWSLSPALLAAAGEPPRFVASFMAAALLGGAVLIWPLGRLSDVLDRRTVLAGGCFAAALAGFGLAGAQYAGHDALLAGSAILGAAMIPLYSIALAHAGDVAAGDDFAEVGRSLQLACAGGAILGPLAAIVLAAAFGGGAVFVFVGVAYILLGLYALYRMTCRPVPRQPHGRFVPMPTTSPAVVELDPRRTAAHGPAR